MDFTIAIPTYNGAKRLPAVLEARQMFLIGRIGSDMLASEDLEALIYIQSSRWEIWHNPNMFIQHKIPNHRLEPKYLSKLIFGIGLARHHTRMIRLKPWTRPIFIVLHFMNDVIRIMLHFVEQIMASQDSYYAPYHRDFLFETLVSPFYLYWKCSLDYLHKKRR